MRKNAFLVLFMMLTFAMSGCLHMTPRHPYDEDNKSMVINKYNPLVSEDTLLTNKQKWAQEHLQDLEFGYYFIGNKDHPETAMPNLDEKDKKVKRDTIVYTLLDLMDMYQFNFNKGFYEDQAGLTSIGEITAAGLGTAASVATPVRVSKLLAALGAATLGTTAIANKHFIQDKATDLIVARMEAIKKETRARIITNMKMGTDQYPLGDALLDVQEYARGGTIFAALDAINRDNAKAQDKADAKLDNAHDINASQPPSDTVAPLYSYSGSATTFILTVPEGYPVTGVAYYKADKLSVPTNVTFTKNTSSKYTATTMVAGEGSYLFIVSSAALPDVKIPFFIVNKPNCACATAMASPLVVSAKVNDVTCPKLNNDILAIKDFVDSVVTDNGAGTLTAVNATYNGGRFVITNNSGNALTVNKFILKMKKGSGLDDITLWGCCLQ